MQIIVGIVTLSIRLWLALSRSKFRKGMRALEAEDN